MSDATATLSGAGRALLTALGDLVEQHADRDVPAEALPDLLDQLSALLSRGRSAVRRARKTAQAEGTPAAAKPAAAKPAAAKPAAAKPAAATTAPAAPAAQPPPARPAPPETPARPAPPGPVPDAPGGRALLILAMLAGIALLVIVVVLAIATLQGGDALGVIGGLAAGAVPWRQIRDLAVTSAP